MRGNSMRDNSLPVGTSQRSTRARVSTVTVLPSGEENSEDPSSPTSRDQPPRSRPLSRSHSRTLTENFDSIRSKVAVARVLPSGETALANLGIAFPLKRLSGRPDLPLSFIPPIGI